jgi:hypothetical protein
MNKYCVAIIFLNGRQTVIPFKDKVAAILYGQELADLHRRCHVYLGNLIEQSTSTEAMED